VPCDKEAAGEDAEVESLPAKNRNRKKGKGKGKEKSNKQHEKVLFTCYVVCLPAQQLICGSRDQIHLCPLLPVVLLQRPQELVVRMTLVTKW
jgi:hypothetical protein